MAKEMETGFHGMITESKGAKDTTRTVGKPAPGPCGQKMEKSLLRNFMKKEGSSKKINIEKSYSIITLSQNC